jgi:photosystem I P700 chlorophyll a apoprotein A1
MVTPSALWVFHVAGQESTLSGEDGLILWSGVFGALRGVGVESRGEAVALASTASITALGLLALGAGQGAAGCAAGGTRDGCCLGGARTAAGSAALLSLLFAGHMRSVVAEDLIALQHLSLGLAVGLGGAFGGYQAEKPAVEHRSLSLSLLGLSAASSSFSALLLSPSPVLTDIPSSFALFAHHALIGSLFSLGSAAHSALSAVRTSPPPGLGSQRDILHGHLVWACTFLGAHSVGPLCHNDSLSALGRAADLLSDRALELRPIFALAASALISPQLAPTADGHRALAPHDASSADFLVSHVHAFSAHVTSLLLAKGIFYSRDSRFVSSKGDLGWRFPCDGPGRGGSCQISAWDHLFLGAFWCFNGAAVLLFEILWGRQSCWGALSTAGFTAIDPSFSSSALSVCGWLRDFLWNESGQVMGGYGSSLAPYTLLFLLSHFVWSLSLMFLFSGRGYWQELVESILWAHLKLRVVPSLSPRALSITAGRAVGLVHFLAGGVGAAGTFSVGRLLGV